MRSDPVLTVLDRPIDDQDGAAVGCLNDPIHRSSLLDGRQDFGPIGFGVDIEAAGRYPVFDQIQQCAATYHNVR